MMQYIQAYINQNPTLLTLEEFFKYHLITELVILTVTIIILVHYRGANKNRSIAMKYQKILAPSISRWFRKYDG